MFRSVVVGLLTIAGGALALPTAGQAAPVCDGSATPSTLASEVSAAAAGQTICLATGDYGTFHGTAKPVTIAAAPGASAQMKLSFGAGDAGFTLDGLAGLGGRIADGARDITIRNGDFTSPITIGGGNTDGIVLEGNRHNWAVGPSNGPDNAKVYFEGSLSGTLAAPAVTLKGSEIRNGDLDGLHIGGGSGYQIVGNTFANLCDQDANHTDNLQFDTSPTTQVRIAGNYVQASRSCITQGITSYDGGTDGVIIEDNVVDIPRPWGIELYADRNSVVRHNTLIFRPASECLFNVPCGQIALDKKPNQTPGSGTHVYDNLASRVAVLNGSTGTAHHNASGQTAHFVGPAEAWAGYALAAGSPVGRGAASDGLDLGIRPSLGGAPTSAPVAPGTGSVSAVWTAPEAAWVGVPVRLDGSRSKGAGSLSCTWSFEDESGGTIWETAPGCTITKRFEVAGIKHIKLVVTDASGAVAERKRTLDIAPRPAGLVAAFSFGETSGSRAEDSSGGGNHGRVRGAKRSADGRLGRGLTFDGNDSVVVGSSRSLRLRGAMTLEAWVRPNATGRTARRVVAKGSDYALLAGRQAGVRVRTSRAHRTSAGTLRAKRWSHLAATYDGKRLRVYVNGRLASSTRVKGGIARGNGRLVIGDGFKGRIDEVRVWRKALTSSAVRASAAQSDS